MKKGIALILILSAGLLCGCGRGSSVQQPALFETLCTADEGLEAAKKSDVVVFEDLRCTAGGAVWDAFYQAVGRGEAASVLCAHYYTLDKDRVSKELYEAEKELYPMLFLDLLEYDGERFTVTVRQSTEEKMDYKATFSYLIHCTGSAPPQADYSFYEDYVLVDDPAVTKEEIMAGLLSSQIGTGIKHYFIYQNLIDERGRQDE